MNNDVFSLLNVLASKYEGASEDTLIKAIRDEATKRKQAGTLSDDDLDSFVKIVSPMLKSEQREKLSVLIKELKNE